ncbi:hypothetical protein ACDF64_11130 [Agromyces sp. MMS24-JH15]|uniref:hypothetical protein n=1 Tax=Agromyces sp. MMS24-JH15 TaxID=3243765 RepID=UPI0037494077
MSSPKVRSDRGAVRVDPRLLIGFALVAGSTLGVWGLVAALDESVEVYAVRETVVPGTRLEASDLAVRSIRIDEATADRYLAAGALPDDGLVVVRTIGAGELVPAAAVDDRADGRTASIVVTTRGALAAGVRPGAAVDVWGAEQVEHGVFGAPAVLVPGAVVAGLVEADRLVAAEGREVELLVPRERVAALLQALAAGDAIDLVGARASGGD